MSKYSDKIGINLTDLIKDHIKSEGNSGNITQVEPRLLKSTCVSSYRQYPQRSANFKRQETALILKRDRAGFEEF